MAIVRKSMDEVCSVPFTFTAEERARIGAIPDTEIERRAAADLDNPPLDAESLARMEAGRTVRRIRERAGLTQTKFAERYRINAARLRDWEQGRFAPDSVALAYLRVIEREPDAVDRALNDSATSARKDS